MTFRWPPHGQQSLRPPVGQESFYLWGWFKQREKVRLFRTLHAATWPYFQDFDAVSRKGCADCFDSENHVILDCPAVTSRNKGFSHQIAKPSTDYGFTNGNSNAPFTPAPKSAHSRRFTRKLVCKAEPIPQKTGALFPQIRGYRAKFLRINRQFGPL